MADLSTLTTWSLTDLKALEHTVKTAIRVVEDREREEALKAARDVAKSMGFDLDEIHTPGKSATVLYVNPEDTSQTWSGRGRRPKWLSKAMSEGATLDAFRV